jgi:hypothetical protein
MRPLVLAWLANFVAVLLVITAVASESVIHLGVLPTLATYRERTALAFLFACLIPWLALWIIPHIYRDPPPGRRIGGVRMTLNLLVGGTLLLAFACVWVFSVLNAIVLVISFIAGAPANADWA